jgi:ammonia channel protein AmtB
MIPTLPVTPALPPAMSDALFALTLALLLLAPLAIAGVALINAGLGRSRSAAQALLGNLAIVAVTAIVFAVVGASFAGCLPGGWGLTIHSGGVAWEWFHGGPLLLGGLGAAPAHSQLALIFEFLAVALAALLPWGSGADRWRLAAGCATAAVTAAFE